MSEIETSNRNSRIRVGAKVHGKIASFGRLGGEHVGEADFLILGQTKIRSSQRGDPRQAVPKHGA
ncbi:hypothetical protein GGE07_005458 [Sinorhizobium terangae]|uniref:Uncharacterized protein n=1 Tax=Sinorhizobium terangae TaxID=110322 RepID=A0A6N7LRL1_SINTE|nr:hypothetical protein [Sinorhizobium terangae]MBB4188779.1 hypothetical protein [Sinorhizobium terangae]MQX18924.1 hypothetical protein [Sinorhizobium terangae]